MRYLSRSFLLILIISSFVVLSGCSENQEVSQLKQQNALLKQQIEQQKQTEEVIPINTQSNYSASENNYQENTTSTYDTTNNDYDEESEKISCCKICSKGKACGDSCINVNYTCHKGPGCACDG